MAFRFGKSCACELLRKECTIKSRRLRYNFVMKLRKIFCIGVAALTLGLVGCQDDDSFSTSTSNTLTFSSDSIKLDTVFSRVPSSTQTMWVYNKSGDGIRCANVRLENGNQTGFRVNVNGEYLGETAGYQVQDVEIRKGDSIRVFVELTSPNNLKETPTLLEDNLVFTLESGVQQKINLSAYTWDATLLNNLEIKHDTTITSAKPIVIRGGIKVDSAATLTISAGTTLYFSNAAGIHVYGKLIANGTADDNIVLRGDRLDHMFDYLPYDRVSGQWQGVHFYESSYDNELNYTDLHSAYNGIVCDSSAVDKLKLTLYNSIIHNCQGYGLLSTNCVMDIWNTQITNTLNDCAAFYGGGVMLRHCTLAQFYPFDAERGVALRFANAKDGVLYPLYQFDVYNTLITGYADDCIMGDFSKDATADFYFENCILRTVVPDTIDSARYVNVVWEDVEDTTSCGEKHFRKVDADMQDYDFRLDSVSSARDAGVVLPRGYSDYDRLGLRRDDKPDLGCYEYQ